MATFTIIKLLIKKTDQDKIDETRSNKFEEPLQNFLKNIKFTFSP